MTPSLLPCTYYTRVAAGLCALVTSATYTFLFYTYDRIPLLVPIQFDEGNPSQFAFKSPALVYLPVGLQLALAFVFLSIVVVLVRRALRPDHDGELGTAASLHVAEAIAILALIWISFQAVNAWRLTELYGRTFDPHMEIFIVALITAFSATVVIVGRALAKVQALSTGSSAVSLLSRPVVDRRHRPLASAVLAAALAVGLAAPLYILATVWGGLRPI